jgi:hypothetical protein
MLNSTNDMAVLMSVTILSLLAFYRVIRQIPDASRPRRRSVVHAVPDISWDGEISDDVSSSFDTNGLSAFGCSKASGSVNFDFFDTSQSRSGLVSFYLGEVAGQGLSASLCQASCTSVLKLASAHRAPTGAGRHAASLLRWGRRGAKRQQRVPGRRQAGHDSSRTSLDVARPYGGKSVRAGSAIRLLAKR